VKPQVSDAGGFFTCGFSSGFPDVPQVICNLLL